MNENLKANALGDNALGDVAGGEGTDVLIEMTPLQIEGAKLILGGIKSGGCTWDNLTNTVNETWYAQNALLLSNYGIDSYDELWAFINKYWSTI